MFLYNDMILDSEHSEKRIGLPMPFLVFSMNIFLNGRIAQIFTKDNIPLMIREWLTRDIRVGSYTLSVI